MEKNKNKFSGGKRFSALEIQLFRRYRLCRSRSINTRKNHYVILRDIAEILTKQFNLQNLKNLKEKHIEFIIHEWKKRGYKKSTLATKIGFLRKFCIAIGKKSCIKDNRSYSVKKGKVLFTDKRWTTSSDQALEIINKVNVQVHKYGDKICDVLKLEVLFGLRKREALRFWAASEIVADPITGKPFRIELTIGTKNNRYRTIPVVTQRQEIFLRELLDKYKFDTIQPFPPNEYKKWERIYYYILDKIGINGLRTGHGLRQTYANDRLKAILEETRRYSDVNNFHESDEKIRMVAYQKLTQELGHGRIDILKSYLADFCYPNKKKK